jgi:uncharacterized protein YjiS (DUF1127 family)
VAPREVGSASIAADSDPNRLEDAMNTVTMTPWTGAKAFTRIAELAGAGALRVVDFVRAYLNRRDLQTLAGFDDRMLADIGLTKSDVRDAVAEPLWRDPTVVLVGRVRERRLARRPGPAQGGTRFVDAPALIPDVEFGLRAGKLTQLSHR